MKWEACRAGSSEFGAVRPHRTSPNHCDVGGIRPTKQFRVSSGWFDHTEPPRTTLLQGEAGLQVRVSSGWFDHTEPPRTTVMKWEACLQAGSSEFPLHHSGSRRFGVVEPQRTHSNLFLAEGDDATSSTPSWTAFFFVTVASTPVI